MVVETEAGNVGGIVSAVDDDPARIGGTVFAERVVANPCNVGMVVETVMSRPT